MNLLQRLVNLFKGKPAAEDNSSWAVFRRTVDDRLTTVLFDTRFRDRKPPPELPIWIDASVAFCRADEQGLPEAGELERLAPLEDRLIEVMARTGAVQVGASARDGRRHWYFYAESAEARKPAEQLLSTVEGGPPVIKMREDPDWSMYRSQLCPTPAEERSMLDNMVLGALANAGDVGDRERRIDHWAYFSSRAAADRFASWATDHGFEVEAVTDPEEDDDRFGVQFWHTGPALPASIGERTIAAQEAAAECGGEYDGWETFVVTE